jgi:mono/diheme cytochrome c family protein
MTAKHATIIVSATAAMLAGVVMSRDRAPVAQGAASPAMLALGDSVFHGRVGAALCYVCHGPAGKGVTGLGPNLTDKEWVNGDGTLAFIEKTITEGVAKPKKMPAPMPPKGGGQLNDAQIRAAAAYVWSLSHPTK